MNIETILQQMHSTHSLLMKERDLNGTVAIKSAVQHHTETIMWLERHMVKIEENTYYNSHPSGVGPESVA